MILFKLRHHGNAIGLHFPTTMAEVNEAVSKLKTGYDPNGRIQITVVDSPIHNLLEYIKSADPENVADIHKLNKLAERIDQMDSRECELFASALDAESINGLDDVLRLTEHLDDYILLPGITSDTELGRFLVDTGYKDFPESVQPYLDYRAIGIEYYGEHGGAYTSCGYVKRRESSQEYGAEHRDSLITVHLRTLEAAGTIGKSCRLSLPATEEELDMAKDRLGVDYFTEATIDKIEFSQPYLEELIPQDCFCVEDANELALGIEEMMQRDGELLKYLSVLSVMEPETLSDALRLAMDLDDYERVTENAFEYGEQVLRRIGAEDEIIGTIEGYMDFEKLGEDSMVEDGVRRTEFGLIRRISEPFPEETQGQQFGGM